MTWQLALASLSGVAAIIGAIVGAVKWATDTAVSGLKTLVDELRHEVNGLRSEVNELEHDKRETARMLRIHAEWDQRAVATLTPEQAAALGSPPPLYPGD